MRLWKTSKVKKDKPKTGGLSQDLENWMSNLPDELKLTPIIYLSIPGSHDSFTANISIKSDIAPDAEDIVKALKLLGPLVKYFIVNWSRTQTYMAKDQLIRGIRYFDLRLATKKDSDDIFFVHSLYSDNVQSVFDEIATFLEDHPQEVVILDCQHFYSFTEADHTKMMQLFNTTFGNKLLPHSDDMADITLDYMTTQNQYQVIVIYRSTVVNKPFIWPTESFPTPWPNTTSPSELITILDEGIKNRSSGTGFISQCVLTPTSWLILKNLLSSLKETCAKSLEDTKLGWINKQKAGIGGLNIIIADYIELTDCIYVRDVIDLNEQLISPIGKNY